MKVLFVLWRVVVRCRIGCSWPKFYKNSKKSCLLFRLLLKSSKSQWVAFYKKQTHSFKQSTQQHFPTFQQHNQTTIFRLPAFAKACIWIEKANNWISSLIPNHWPDNYVTRLSISTTQLWTCMTWLTSFVPTFTRSITEATMKACLIGSVSPKLTHNIMENSKNCGTKPTMPTIRGRKLRSWVQSTNIASDTRTRRLRPFGTARKSSTRSRRSNERYFKGPMS